MRKRAIRSADDKLKSLLARRRAELVERILGQKGEITSGDLEPIDNIRRLLAIGTDYTENTRRARWVQIALAGIAGLAVLTLLLLPLRQVELALEAEVHSLRFKTTGKAAIALPLSVRRMVVRGQAKVFVPGDAASEPVALLSPAVRIESKKAGAVQLEFPQIPAGTEAEVAGPSADGIVEVTLCGVDEPTHITITGPAMVAGESNQALDPSRPMQLLVIPKKAHQEDQTAAESGRCGSQSTLRYQFEAERSSDVELITNLGIRDLELSSESRGQDGVLRPRSSVVTGLLRITSVGGKTRMLARNEFLILEGNSGELRGLVLKPGSLGIVFEGSADGLYGGTRANRSSMMPTLFEWLQSRDLNVLAWTTGLSALGLLLGLYGWLRSAR